MTACRTSWLPGVFLAVLFLTGARSQPAQPPATGLPQQLPTGEPTPPAGPSDFKPGDLGNGTRRDVASNELGIVDGPPVGSLDDSTGGLGQSMWVNSGRTDVEDLLGRIPLASADPFVRALSRRVVLTKSDAPVGPAKRALVAIRIEKLLQAGLIAEAGAIASSLQLNGDSDFGRVQADALLYAGRDADVCSDLTATRLTSAEPFWLQLRAWCFASAGDDASADLTRSVLDAQGASDKAFDVLLDDALAGKKTLPAPFAHGNAVHIFLLHRAGLPVTSALAAGLGTAANVIAARDARNTPADRLRAATRISQTGALAPAEILSILNAQTISSDQVAHATDLAANLPFLPAQSLLRRAARLESRPSARASLLGAALSADGHADRLTLSAALQGDLAESIRPDALLRSERSLIARALVLYGRPDAAAAWYDGTTQDTEFNAFQILLDLAAPNPHRDAAAQAALAMLSQSAAPQTDPSPLAALALGLSDVLGKSMPPAAKSLAVTLEGTRWPDGRRPASDDISKLEAAASQPGRKGEVALRVLDIVGPNGPHGLPADVTIECVRILEQSGLGDDARALAIEALALQPASP